MTNPNKNYNCENDKCVASNSEVRLLPTGGDSNGILCRPCFDHEMRYRAHRNKYLGKDCQFKIEKWEDLKVYENV